MSWARELGNVGRELFGPSEEAASAEIGVISSFSLWLFFLFTCACGRTV